uniref:UspA domain-containing protein n=1 Tax=Chlamydomonas leiostraca TaxID=1034604 RepID=A0A7S0QZT8_9CHLO|mmetsp:Transcript_1107/g.3100  ORF Transcript_1107/g.3100 Transcript_1107/m.3100 type:complete len:326 (+) Transcript_1107:61-1038(+)|eukprot:CAMPEP_0202858406 /NCGR_PEP_ID=MMETSP1391-20130828/957_1 /ASSEMBLY_ACC=CAM_ASM_000867 /TAXON_ID=1034604 /ORGANISM="Chlamydomonas leiostraca, Strain SAG 11-49" /LENGTH=325 /DNA_ID=CAMNT_0049537327 /DNA_START=45 /DNA_END=1022 /DNA_ORIENTATION=-
MSDLKAVEEELKRRHQGGLSIGLAVDGSQMSDRAAQCAVSFTDTRKDKLTVLHVSDKSKSYLPQHLRPTHIKNYYQDMVASLKLGCRAEWLCREKSEGESTCAALTTMADKAGVDLLVLGSFGRKGEKLDMLGTVSDFTLRQSHASLCIVRSTGSKFDKQARFCFATDGSHAAHLAFVVLINLLRRPLDIVHVVMVSSTDGVLEQKCVEQYKQYMEAKGVTGTTTVKCIDRLKMSIPEGVLEAVADTDSDVLVMGISGYGKKKLGSVSEDISVRASCTTIIIKDSYEVLSNRFSSGGAGTLARELMPSPTKAPSHQNSFSNTTRS